MPKNGIRQFIITLSSSQRTHTHQLPTPQGALTSRLALTFRRPPRLRGNSSSLPDPHRDPQTRSSRLTRDLATRTTSARHEISQSKFGGGLREARSPLPIQTLSGRPGRRRGALTRRKLRNRFARVKSPGGHPSCRTSSQVTVCRQAPKPAVVRPVSTNPRM